MTLISRYVVLTVVMALASTAIPRASEAAWYAYATDASGISAYTFLSVVNLGKKEETVTVTFRSADGTDVASTSSALAPRASLTLSSASGFSNPVATGDFEGYVEIISTGSDKKLALTGSFLTPTDGSGAIGNALAVSGYALTWTRGKPPK